MPAAPRLHTAGELSMEDMIPDETMVITISHEGYIKRTSLTNTAARAGEELAREG